MLLGLPPLQPPPPPPLPKDVAALDVFVLLEPLFTPPDPAPVPPTPLAGAVPDGVFNAPPPPPEQMTVIPVNDVKFAAVKLESMFVSV
jgi:cytokinesis protein